MKSKNTSNLVPTKIDPIQPEVEDVKMETQESLLAFKNAGLLRKIFPDPEYRELAKAKLALLKTELEARRVIVELIRNAQIEHLRKELNAHVSVHGIIIDKEKEKEIRVLVREREKEVNMAVLEFAEDYDVAVKTAESRLKGKVKELEMQRLDKVLLDFYSTIDFFKDEFMKSIKLSIPSSAPLGTMNPAFVSKRA